MEREGTYFLRPRSTLDRFEELEIGKPDFEHANDEEVRVIALVLGHINARSLDLLKRLGKVNEQKDTQ